MFLRLANVIRWTLYGLGGVIVLFALGLRSEGSALFLGVALLVIGLGRAVKYVVEGK